MGLFTDRWVLRHRQTTQKGMLMVLHIDSDSVRALEAIDFQTYFGLGRVTFQVHSTNLRLMYNLNVQCLLPVMMTGCSDNMSRGMTTPASPGSNDDNAVGPTMSVESSPSRARTSVYST